MINIIVLIISIVNLILNIVLLKNWLFNNQYEYIDALVTEIEELKIENNSLRKQVIEILYKEVE